MRLSIEMRLGASKMNILLTSQWNQKTKREGVTLLLRTGNIKGHFLMERLAV